MKRANYFRFAWLLVFAYLFILMVQITLRYLPFSTEIAFLQIKQTEVTSLKAYLPLFYIHVFSSIFALVAGFTQFNTALLAKYRKLHRAFGYFYFIIVVFLAAPSGIFIGYYANGGIFSQISFMLLGILWWFFTAKAIIEIKKGNVEMHRQFMLRSFALAFSAITLRLWKVILVYLFHPAPMDVYQIIAWLGWIPNLLLIEYLIRKNKNL